MVLSVENFISPEETQHPIQNCPLVPLIHDVFFLLSDTGIGDGDIALAEEIIEPFLKAFPKVYRLLEILFVYGPIFLDVMVAKYSIMLGVR